MSTAEAGRAATRKSGASVTVTAPLASPVEFEIPEFTVYLPPGVREPAALLDPQEGLSDQQAEALADLSDEFIRQLEETAATSPEETITETWDQGQEDADSQYRNLFGEAAYNRMLMEAAIADLVRAGQIP
jgi:hypothetical protein